MSETKPSTFLIAKGGKFVEYTDPADIARQNVAISNMQRTNPALVARIQSGEQARLVSPTHGTFAPTPPTLTNAQRMQMITSKLITAMGGASNIKPGTGQPIDMSKVKPAAIVKMIENYEIEAPGPVTNLRHLRNEVSQIKAQGNASIVQIDANLEKNSDAYHNPSKYNWSTYEGGYTAFKQKYQELITSREKISEVLSGNDKKVLEYADIVANWGKNVTTTEVTKWKVGDVTYDTYEDALKAQKASQKWTVEGKTYDTFADAEKARIAATKYSVTYKEPGSDTESTVTFDTKDKADNFREQLSEQYLATQKTSSYGPIPGPGAGPRPGSIGYEISSRLTGALMATEAQLESTAQFLRQLSSKAWVDAANSQLAGDTVGTIWHLAGAVSTRATAGIWEGATFLVRPVQWAQLATLPIIVASNPTKFLNTIKADAGGIAIESLGALAGGWAVSAGLGRVFPESNVVALSDVKIKPLVKGNIKGVEITPKISKTPIPGNVAKFLKSVEIIEKGDIDVLVGTSKGDLVRGLKLVLKPEQIKSLLKGKKVWVETGERSVFTTPLETTKIFMGTKPELGIVGGFKEFKELGPESPYQEFPEMTGIMGGEGSAFRMKILGGMKTEKIVVLPDNVPIKPDPTIFKTSLNKTFADLLKAQTKPVSPSATSGPLVSSLDSLGIHVSPVTSVAQTSSVYSNIGAAVGGTSTLSRLSMNSIASKVSDLSVDIPLLKEFPILVTTNIPTEISKLKLLTEEKSDITQKTKFIQQQIVDVPPFTDIVLKDVTLQEPAQAPIDIVEVKQVVKTIKEDAITEYKTRLKLKLAEKKKLKLRTHEFPEGSRFRVLFTYAKGTEKFVIPTRTFEGALSRALNSKRNPAEPKVTEIRRVST